MITPLNEGFGKTVGSGLFFMVILEKILPQIRYKKLVTFSAPFFIF